MSELSIVRWCRPSNKSTGESGWRPAIVKPGHKWLHLVHFSDGGHVVVSKIPAGEERFFQPLMLNGKPYPLARAARTYLRKPKSFITKAARAILEEARNG
jgi:hypothetical protein